MFSLTCVSVWKSWEEIPKSSAGIVNVQAVSIFVHTAIKLQLTKGFRSICTFVEMTCDFVFNYNTTENPQTADLLCPSRWVQ